MRYRWLWVAVALVAASLVGAALAGPGGTELDGGDPPGDRLFALPDEGGYVWPYTSRRQSTAGRTLALSVVVQGDPQRVRGVLEDRSNANWTAVDDDGLVDATPWRPARGAARYSYVAADRDGTGQWVDAAYQVGVGTYLGHRTHVRAYPVPVGNWTAMQTHTEYWDWFRLRHTVTGVGAGARVVERDLRDEPFVADVRREYHGLDGGGSDGWMTVVELAPAVLAATLPVAVRRRQRAVEAALPVALAAVVLGVRGTGLAAEALFPAVDPKLFAAVLYPVMAAGPPLVVGAFARRVDPARATLLAPAGFGAGLVVDLGVVGVHAVPVKLALHRVALAAALAALALGVARADRRTVAVGLGAWVTTLAATLLGVV